ncbi:Protein of unknown function (DUF3017) [Bifidobacterium psychraerophilum DSM 22366]|uniref:DUF3017 domain-containing protein n=2 Tax=Bifidobacterium psychraerophilum TaxID=218140 RepID=UPI000CB10FCC|nr:DUF3017 domain-containing protein [Bifidobacterium psychraerophilum]PKA95497.1 Protein of unknown function (DUF3017) [Bifidobacterium psychraerophilum DSM 22366]
MGHPQDPDMKKRKSTHPFVSERHEGNPLFEWSVTMVVVASGIIAWFGYHMAATVIISVAAICTAVLRLTLRERSPWKVRSVAFDSFIGIALGLGLLVTYFSIRLLL